MDSSIDRLRLRHILTLSVICLLLLGVLMVQSASVKVGGPITWSWSPDAWRHLWMVLAGFAAYLIVGRLNDRKLLPLNNPPSRSPAHWLLAAAAILGIAVFLPVIGSSGGGAQRWVQFGAFRFQPSELAKWATVLWLAYRLCRPEARYQGFFRGTLITLIPVGFLVLLTVLEDFGTAALIATVALGILIVGRTPWLHLLAIVPPGLTAAFLFVYTEPYRWRRMTSFLDPFADPKGEGYHMVQSLLSFTTGGLLGTGMGNGVQKLGYLPEDTTDFIFAVICEELGLFGAALTLSLYAAILFVAWQALRALTTPTADTPPRSLPLTSAEDTSTRNTFTQLLIFGITMMVVTQAIINIAVATVSVPTKGLSLPLVSFGGTGLVMACAALGLMHAIIRRKELEIADTETADTGTEASPRGMGFQPMSPQPISPQA
jgi:cell division protein FtsW